MGPTAPPVSLSAPPPQAPPTPEPFAPASPAAIAALAGQMAASFESVYNQRNIDAVAAYNKGVAMATALGIAPPAPPMLTVVNADLIQQDESLANTGAQPDWSNALMEIQYIPPAPPPVAAALVLGAQVGPGIFKLIVNSGYGPSDGQSFTLNGVDYIAHWQTEFGPVYAQQKQ